MATKTPLAGISVTSPVLTFSDLDPFDAQRAVGAVDLFELMEPERFDLGVFEQAVLQDFLGAQLVAAVDQGDLGSEVGQEQRLFDGCVAAANHDDFLSAIEKPVAGGAGRHAKAFEFLF